MFWGKGRSWRQLWFVSQRLIFIILNNFISSSSKLNAWDLMVCFIIQSCVLRVLSFLHWVARDELVYAILMWLGNLTFCVCRTRDPIHFDQEIFLFCHSYNNPTPRMVRRASVIHDFLTLQGSMGKDSTRVISMSNIRNNNEIRKN